MTINIVTLAVAIVASFAGGGAYYAAGRGGCGAWLSFMLGLLTFAVLTAVLVR